jgi:hypothetical protein
MNSTGSATSNAIAAPSVSDAGGGRLAEFWVGGEGFVGFAPLRKMKGYARYGLRKHQGGFDEMFPNWRTLVG